ncbi:MAG: DUF2292 domain-containing protein [Chloroflexi bacterium]|nr:DUF2292 domain-containing protein [Chloroflexota bacterium]
MKNLEPLRGASLPNDLHLLKLTIEQVRRIDEMLDDVGEYGEVHIIVQRGELRYINKVESYRFVDREEGE